MTILFESLKKETLREMEQKVQQMLKETERRKSNKESLLTADEVIVKYKISKSTLERHVRNGLKYSSRGKGFKRMFSIEDIESFFKTSGLNNKIRNNG